RRLPRACRKAAIHRFFCRSFFQALARDSAEYYLQAEASVVHRRGRVQKYPAAAAIAALKKPGRYAVGDGAYFQISKWLTRSWIFRCERLGHDHHLQLGTSS